MDIKKIIGIVIATALAIASAVVGYNFKEDVCGPETAPAVAEVK